MLKVWGLDMKKATNPKELAALTETSEHIITDTTSKTQRDAIIRVLYRESRNTLEFRAMGIASPAPRIKELRDAGWDIRDARETATDTAGVEHHGIARYSLHGFIESKGGAV
jgi:hypothetical protein